MPRRYRELYLSPLQAARGAAVELETPAGRVLVNIPKGARSGLVIRLRRAGRKRLFSGRRHLYLRLWVLNSLLEPEPLRNVDPRTRDDVDFVLRFVRRGLPDSVFTHPLDVRRLYDAYLDTGDPNIVQRALAATVGEAPVPVEFSDWLELPGLLRTTHTTPRLGVPEHPVPRRIFIAAPLADDPLAVGAVVAHESAHAFLFRRGYYDALNPRLPEPEGPRHLDRRDEELTDLSVFALGWGDLTLNALRYTDQGWWALGYLNAATIRLAARRARDLID